MTAIKQQLASLFCSETSGFDYFKKIREILRSGNVRR